MHPKRRSILLLLASGIAGPGLVGTTLVGCGGGDDDEFEQTQVRLVNATSGIASADLYRGDERVSSGATRNTGTGYSTVDDGSATFKVTVSGQSVSLASVNASLDDDTGYTALAWGRGGAVKLTMLTDDADEPDGGSARLRVFNAAPDADTLDVFLTDTNVNLEDSSPVAQAAPGEGDTEAEPSAWSQLGARSYRLRVTAADDPTDVRLDVADFPVGDRERVTLVLHPGDSGVLVHALKLVQRGAVTAYQNTNARLRLVASVGGAGRVGLAVGGTTLVASLGSPGIGTYLSVAAGAATPAVTVGGVAVSVPAQTFAAGTDYTLLVYGSAASPQVSLLVDDNRLPTTDGKAKLRLVNGLVSQASLSLTLDSVTVASDVAPGATGAPVQVTANDDAVLEAFGDSADPLFSTAANPIAILDGAVYTFFLLDGAATPADRLRRDR